MKQHHFLLCLPQSKQTAASPSPSQAGGADGLFEAKLGGEKEMKLEESNSLLPAVLLDSQEYCLQPLAH